MDKVFVCMFYHFVIIFLFPKEPHMFSVRQIQLAKKTPSQVIQLAFLCALLEQRNKTTNSKRFEAITNFLKKAVNVVPVESIFDAITFENHKIALDCAKALSQQNILLQPSQLMIFGALRACIRARTGHTGNVIDQCLIPGIKSYRQAIVAAKQWLEYQTQAQQMPLKTRQLQLQPKHAAVAAQLLLQSPVTQQPKQQAYVAPKAKQQAYVAPKAKQHAHDKSLAEPKIKPPSANPVLSKKYSDAVVTGKPNSYFPRLHPQLMALPLFFPFFINLSQYPTPVPFPSYLTKHLEKCLLELIEAHPTIACMHFGAELGVVSKSNIVEVYPTSIKRKTGHFKSPIKVLSDALLEISQYTDSSDVHSATPLTKMPNEQMLALIEKIFSCDVAICASLLGAFMEQQIRIPLIHTLKNTAETLSERTAPVAVGVWALFSQNRATLQAKLNSSNHSKLIVEIREYMEGISQQLPGNEGKLYAENEDKMYAGKLQFLLQGIQQIVTASNQYISYSLEHQLCSNLKFDQDCSLKHLITDWDTIFENDALSLIGESHRPLVARWLKWTILVHNLREALAEYTCIGVTGLVNSGKSLLVKELFKLEVRNT